MEGLPQDHPVRAALAHFERSKSCWKIELGPLDLSELNALIAHALEDPGVISPETMSAICTLAEGNPFFAEELLKSAILQVPHQQSERRLPQTIAQAVRERVAAMGPEPHRILSTAAAVGRRFNAAMLAELSAVSIADLLPTVKQARDVQLIVDAPAPATNEFEFRHALIQEALYDELLVSEQRELHERIGARLESSPQEGNAVIALAYHWWQARNYEKAAHYNEMAGDAATELYAFSDAALVYERAVASTEELRIIRPDLLIKLGGALLYAGSGERSRAAYQKALDYYEAQGSLGMVAETCVGYGRTCFDIGYYADARRMVEKALALLEDATENSLYFSAEVLLSLIYFREANPSMSLAQLDKADQFTGERSSHDTIALHNHRGIAMWLLGDRDLAVENFERALDAASASHDALWQVSILGNMGLCLAGFGERERAEACMHKALTIAEERRIHGFFVACCLLQFASISSQFRRARAGARAH